MLNPSSVLKRSVKLPVLVFLYLSCSVAQAQLYNSSVSAATGGSGRASVEAGDAVYLNPATLAQLRDRHFFSSFAKNQMAFSLSDNSEDAALPGGLSYLQTKSEDGTIKNNDLSMSLAEMISRRFSFGFTAHYFQSDVNETHYSQTNADFGMTFIPRKNFGFGAVLYNVFGSRNNIPDAVKLLPKFGLGINYVYEDLMHFRLDATSAPDYNFGKSAVMGGFETFFAQFFVWRLGAQYDAFLERTLTTVGLGFVGPRFSLNYAYQGATKDSSDYRHSIDLVIPF